MTEVWSQAITGTDERREALMALCQSVAEARAELTEEQALILWRLIPRIEISPDGCWLWTLPADELGYARVGRLLGETRAHRIAYRFFNGPIPDGQMVRHACDVRHCINPNHLSLGTQYDNMQDMKARGRWAGGDTSGENNGQARLTQAKVAEMRALSAQGWSGKRLAMRFGVSPMTVSRAIRRETWK